MYLKENVKVIREYFGKTQAEMAEILGVSRGSLSQYEMMESAVKPGLTALINLENFSGIPIKDICLVKIDARYFANKNSNVVQEPRAVYMKVGEQEVLERLKTIEDFLQKVFAEFKRRDF